VFGFYRLYIKDYSNIAKPLNDLLTKNKPNRLHWSSAEQLAFDQLKSKICDPPVLMTPEIGKPYIMYTDASQFAVGCGVAQLNEVGEEHPVAYGSQKLSPTQTRWSTIEREAYAIIWALNKFRDITFGCHITLFSDHDPLRYLSENVTKSAKLTRWALALQEFDVTVCFKKGQHNSLLMVCLASGMNK